MGWPLIQCVVICRTMWKYVNCFLCPRWVIWIRISGKEMFAMVLIGNKTTSIKSQRHTILHQHRHHQYRPDQIFFTIIIIFIATIFRCCRYSASFLPFWRWSTVSCSLSFLWTLDSLLWYWGHYHNDGDDDFGEDNVDGDGDKSCDDNLQGVLPSQNVTS